MRAEPDSNVVVPEDHRDETSARAVAFLAVAMAALTGLALLVDSLGKSSATFDEAAYLRVAAHWWRTGDQDEITRLGSPLTFWKLQQAPVLWFLDQTGRRALVDDPIGHQEELLPLVRLWSLSIWLAAFSLTAAWSRQLYGPRAMALAAWLFALGPNLLAHGALATMEFPLLACTTALFFLFWRFLRTGSAIAFWGSAAIGGLSWSCKYTTVLVPPLLGLIWWIDRWLGGERRPLRLTFRVGAAMAGFVMMLAATDLIITGFASLPISQRSGGHPSVDGRFGPIAGPWIARALETPIPQDLTGFVKQVLHQRSGGSSYLWGERRMQGWWYYYLVALAVKVPLTLFVLLAARAVLGRGGRIASTGKAWILPATIAAFLAITAVGSSRNYGLRYVLPLAPLAIVWVSGLAEGGRRTRRLAALGVLGQAMAVASAHPYELSYFNGLAGGTIGGRHVLADSNLDWGQGLKPLARLQRDRPEFRDLTLYYFGDTEPRHYGVAGEAHVIDAGAVHPRLPAALSAATRYVAVSASLQWGPWGPPGYFRRLDPVTPVCWTDDGTIAIYRWPIGEDDSTGGVVAR